MIYLLLTLFTLNAHAQDCYLSIDENGTQFVDCRIGAVPPNYKRICPMVDSVKDGSVYKVEVHKDELTTLEKALEFVGIQSEKVKDWTGEALAEGEFIVCSIDAEKVALKEAARAAKEAEEKTKRDKVKSDWGAVCGNPKVGFETVVCEDAKARGLW
jgi:hypothetical protein